MALAVVSVRVEAPIPGKPYVGIEIPNTKRRGIPLRSVIESPDYQESKHILPLPLGMRVDSRFMVAGLEEMPHLLVAGTTGSGKSVFTNTCILGMCSKRTPNELKLILVDPKHVEFAVYDGLPHLLSRPISEPKKAVSALAWAVQEMESRSQMFALSKVRNLESYNAKLLPKSRLPYIAIVVDELADLMYTAGKEVESLIARLAQKARSAGIHMILATQRPSVDVITGLIKANIPARIAFAVPSQTDSRTIIDTAGADKLLGKGDMLFLSIRYPRPVRLQASFVDEKRIMTLIECLKQSFGQPEYIEFEDFKDGGKSSGASNNAYDNGITLDPKINEALNFIMDTGIASASKLQTIMGIGYPRASRIISTLEQLGILGPQSSSPTKPREILMNADEAFQIINENR
jgi:S-DNA-T family DNA segregation ATPase FtsK/SpoIIIE